MVARVRTAMAGPLPAAVAKMRLYMTSPTTHAVLLKPIKANVTEAHHQVRSCPSSHRGAWDKLPGGA